MIQMSIGNWQGDKGTFSSTKGIVGSSPVSHHEICYGGRNADGIGIKERGLENVYFVPLTNDFSGRPVRRSFGEDVSSQSKPLMMN